jgi:hypothetical protein
VFYRYSWGMISVMVRVYDLEVEIQSSENFPDHLDDICNRATKLFAEAVETMKLSNISLSGEDLIDGEEQG